MLRRAMRWTTSAVGFVAALACAGGWATGCGSRTGLFLFYTPSDDGGSSDSGTVEPPTDSGMTEPVNDDSGGPAEQSCDAQAGPIVLAWGQSPLSLAVDSTDVYWTNADPPSVMKVSKVSCGGTPVTLVSGLPYASPEDVAGLLSGIAVDSARVYWTEISAGNVMSVPIGGGTPTTLASGEIRPTAIAVDTTSAYWIVMGEENALSIGSIMKVPLSGGEAITLASEQVYPSSNIVVDGTKVYWAQGAAVAALMSEPLDGGIAITLVAGAQVTGIANIAVDSTSIYWTEGTVTNGFVMKAPLGGGTPTMLASGLGQPAYIAVDATNVYWTDFGNDPLEGNVMSVPISGGSPTELASGLTAPGGIAVDGTSAYWWNGAYLSFSPNEWNSDAGTVMKLTPK
jgi:hypothetical protein